MRNAMEGVARALECMNFDQKKRPTHLVAGLAGPVKARIILDIHRGLPALALLLVILQAAASTAVRRRGSDAVHR